MGFVGLIPNNVILIDSLAQAHANCKPYLIGSLFMGLTIPCSDNFRQVNCNRRSFSGMCRGLQKDYRAQSINQALIMNVL